MSLSAVIFDLDGTVLSNEDEWGKAFGMVLKKLGAKKVPSYPHVGGIGIEENWPILIKKFNLKTTKTYEELASETRLNYSKLLKKVKLKKGFKKLIKDLRDSGIKTALATSSTWSTVEEVFDKLKIEEDFDLVTTGEEVFHKKPDPEIFEIVADKLGVSPSECLVFEDSSAGIDAAKKAGMKVIGVYRSKKHKETLRDADLLIKNFNQITPQILARFVG